LEITIILEHLIPKYASFQIRPLLSSFHTLFRELCRVNREAFLATVVRELDVATSRVAVKTNAVGNYFTLLDWVNYILPLSSADNEDFVHYLPDLVRWQGFLLYKCLAEAKKKGLRASALRTTRACLRGVFQQKQSIVSGNTVESYIKILSGAKTSPFASAVLLGVVAGVSARLRNKLPNEVVESSKSFFYDFFLKEILGSKTRVPEFVMVSLQWT